MVTDTLVLFLICAAAACACIVVLGVGWLLKIRVRLTNDLLARRCHEENVRLLIAPGEGFWARHERPHALARTRGTVCLTEHELIFIPQFGERTLNVPMGNVVSYDLTPDESGWTRIVTDVDPPFFWVRSSVMNRAGL